MKSVIRAVVISVMILFGSVAHGQVLYTVTDIGLLPGAVSTIGWSVNNSGQVAGQATFSTGTSPMYRAFRWSAGTGLVDISAGLNSAAYALNDSGQVAGVYNLAGGTTPRGFRTSATGTLADPTADLGLPAGFTGAEAKGINASGQVTGFLTGGSAHAFRTTATGSLSDPGVDLGQGQGNAINASGQVTGTNSPNGHAFRTTATGNLSDPASDLGVLPGSFVGSNGLAINVSGMVAGSASLSGGGSHAFRTTATGTLSDPSADLGTLPGDLNAVGEGINALGVVVGVSNGGATSSAFIDDGSGMYDLNTLIPAGTGWQLEIARGISDTGFIVGQGHIGGELHAFLLTPVPEPSSLLLVGPALAVGWLARRRRRRAITVDDRKPV
jgi:probable HAF family extracellular repeat protein